MRRLTTISLAMSVAIATIGGTARAQAPVDEAQVKAAFVYNFLKFVDWPPESFAGPRDSLVVGIVGTNASAEATARFLDGKQVNNRVLVIRRLDGGDPIAGLHAVFFGDDGDGRARRVLDAAASEPILSIGEGSDFTSHGGVIALIVDAQKIRFEIDTATAGGSGLRISSKLLALARFVHERRRKRDVP